MNFDDALSMEYYDVTFIIDVATAIANKECILS
jgi:hypothetical protein